MLGSGIRLQILKGTNPLPAPYAMARALQSIEVREESINPEVFANARDDVEMPRDTFEMTFTVGRRGSAMSYSLVNSGIVDPSTRITLVVIFGARPQLLINGIITNKQLSARNAVGETTLTVQGESLVGVLDLEDKNEQHPNQSHSTIVTNILNNYLSEGLVPDVQPTSETPTATERTLTQQGTDLYYIQQLARKNGFIFYVEPTPVPGISRAVWGPENRQGSPQPALKMNRGGATNTENINFGLDALAAANPQITVTEPNTGQTISVPIPDSLLPALAGQAPTVQRSRIDRETGNLDFAQAFLRATVGSNEAADVVTATGSLDAIAYGRALRARRLVDVAGAGERQDCTYYVKRVTHRISKGSYKQQFTLAREGEGATCMRVTQ